MFGYMLDPQARRSEPDSEFGRFTLRERWYLRAKRMSARTRDALFENPRNLPSTVSTHTVAINSVATTVEWSDVILAMEASHVTFVRTRFPDARAKTVVLGQFLREAPLDATLLDQVGFVASLDPDPRL